MAKLYINLLMNKDRSAVSIVKAMIQAFRKSTWQGQEFVTQRPSYTPLRLGFILLPDESLAYLKGHFNPGPNAYIHHLRPNLPAST